MIYLLQRFTVGILLVSGLMTTAYAQNSSSFTLEDWLATPTELKTIYVDAIMEQAKVNHVVFKQPVDFYRLELDKLAAFSREKRYDSFFKTPVARNLATIAVVNCDWSNGVAPYEFAKKYLGTQQLDYLKPLYAEQLQKLAAGCE